MIRPQIFLLLFTLMIPFVTQANASRYYDRISDENGFNQQTVNCLYQDEYGFVWMGTPNGVIKYDGKDYQTFNYLPNDSTSIIDNSIRFIHGDQQGQLWFGTDKGISIYSFDEDQFSVIQSLNKKLDTLSPLQNIIQLDSLTQWVITSKEVLEVRKEATNYTIKELELDFIQENDHLIDIHFNDNRCYILSDNTLYVAKREDSGNYTLIEGVKTEKAGEVKFVDFLFNEKGNHCYIATENQILTYDLNWEIIQLINTSEIKIPHSNSKLRINKIRKDKEGNIWVATQNGGVVQYFVKTKTFLQNDASESVLMNNEVLDILQDNLGVYWFATSEKGICIFDPYKKPFKVIKHDETNPTSISSNLVSGFFMDSEQRLWLGGFKNGLNRSNEPFELENTNNLSFEKEFGNMTIYAFSQYKHFVLIATQNGLKIYDSKTKKYIKYQPQRELKNTVTVMEVIDDHLYLYSGYKFSVFSLNEVTKNGSISLVLEREDKYDNILRLLKKQDVQKIYNDGARGLLIGSEKGLYQTDRNFSKLTLYKSNKNEENALGSNRIFSIYRDSSGQLWIGTFGAGLYKAVEKEDKIDHFEKISPFPDNVVYSIMEDKNNRLWMSTDVGIVVYDTRSQQIKHYNVSDGLITNKFRKNSFGKDKYGTMLIGSLKGIVVFNPMEIHDSPISPQPQILKMKVKNKVIEPQKEYEGEVLLNVPIYKTTEVTLPYTMNQITLELGAISYGSKNNIKFEYRLKGVDNGWVQKDADQGYANYTKLSPGEYLFEVKTLNRDGVESKEIKQLLIKIETHWFKTVWAYLTYITIVLLIVFGIYKYIANMVSLEKKVLAEKKDKEHLIEINEAKLTFFTNISHEIRTPLTLILTPLERLTDHEKLHPELKSFVRNININGQRLLNLTNSLIDFRKIGKGEIELKSVQQDIVPFMRKTAEAFLGYAKDKKIDYSIDIEEKSVIGWFDKAVLERIIFNLLSNSFKYTKEKGKITFKVWLVEKQLRFEIKDSGVGISEKDQNYIFDIFYKGNHQPTKFGSSGIGLYLVKQLVELHSGKIEFESKEKLGSVFSVSIPTGVMETNEVAEEVLEVVDFDGKEEENQETTSTKKKILLVEDNEELRQLVHQMFHKEYQVFLAKDGVEGFEIALKEQPSLVITDVNMPNMNGYELSEKLKNTAETSHVMIIFLTAMADIESQKIALEKGGQIHISKPFSPKVLALQVKNLLSQAEKETKVIKKKIIMSPEKEEIQTKDDIFLQKVNEELEKGYQENSYSIEQLADALNMSYIQFYRKFKTLTDSNAKQYLREFRLRKAKELIEKDPDLSVYDVMYSVGFNSHSYFTISFKKVYGMTPATLRNQVMS